MNISKLPLRQKQFVLGAAAVAATASGGGAEAQSVSYSAGLANASVSGNPGLSGGNDTTTNATENSLGTSVGVSLQAFNPNLNGNLNEITSVSLSLVGQLTFSQSGSWSVNATAVAYTFVVSMHPASATLQLTQPSFGTLVNASPAGSTCSSSTSGVTSTKGKVGNLNCTFASGQGSGSNVLTNANFAAGSNFATPGNFFYGAGNIPSLQMDLQDASIGSMANVTDGAPNQIVTTYVVTSFSVTGFVTYNYITVPGPDALALFIPGMGGMLLSARRRRPAMRMAA